MPTERDSMNSINAMSQAREVEGHSAVDSAVDTAAAANPAVDLTIDTAVDANTASDNADNAVAGSEIDAATNSTIDTAINAVIAAVPSIKYRSNEPMRDHSSFKIGGCARALFLPGSIEELISICSILKRCGIAPVLIGNGTNLLFDDAALNIVVIKTTLLDGISLSGTRQITAQSGALLSKLASFACNNGLTGLEFAHGIPGTLGGALTMNAGAYGGEMKDCVLSTTVYSRDSSFNDSPETLLLSSEVLLFSDSPSEGLFFTDLSLEGSLYNVKGDAHGFSYRNSRFSDSNEVILSSTLTLSEGDPILIKKTMDEYSIRRRDSQPLDLPSAGSTFKRPRDGAGYAAALIEQSQLKGYTIGGAQVSTKHSGFIVNLGGATFSDVTAVIDHVRETVFRKFGVDLEPEVGIIRG